MKQFGYSKSEKLKQKKDISLLFEKGKWQRYNHLRIIYRNTEQQQNGVKLGVSVSKRYFKKAVDRNRLKRFLRECYRLNKTIFKQKFGEDTHAMLFWASHHFPKNFKEVEEEFKILCIENSYTNKNNAL